MTTCAYCMTRALLGQHHEACPARPTAEEVAAEQHDSERLNVGELAIWRQGYDDAARGKAPGGDVFPAYQLGWAMRLTRDSPPQLRPALFLSLRALLERLRGRELRTDSFGIQLASSFFYLDGDMRIAEAVMRTWPGFPRLREASTNEDERVRARAVLATETDSVKRAEATVVLHGEQDDDVRTRVKGLLRSADATGRLRWRGDRAIDLAEIDAFLERCGLAPTELAGVDLLTSTHPQAPSQPQVIAAIIESANGGSLLGAA